MKKPRPMTLVGFLHELRKSKRLWHLRGQTIRCERWDCPILAVWRATITETSYWDLDNDGVKLAARDLRLPLPIARKIVHAADGPRGRYRGVLLRACGLKEEK